MAGFLKFSSLVFRWDFHFFSFRWDKPKPTQIRLPFSGKFLSKFIRHISLIKKSIVATGVNLVTEVEKLNMAMKFVAPVIAFALLVIASSVGKPPGEKSLFYRRKNPRLVMLAEENRSPIRSNGSRSGACVLIFPLCHGRVPLLSHARCQNIHKNPRPTDYLITDNSCDQVTIKKLYNY